MWKIKIVYSDKSKTTITGKHRDIPLELARHYHKLYVVGKDCEDTYQQYPKKDYQSMGVLQKIEELEACEMGSIMQKIQQAEWYLLDNN